MELARPYHVDVAAIAMDAPALRVGAPIGAVFELLDDFAGLPCVAIVDAFDRPVGTASRSALAAAGAGRGDPVDAFMDSAPIVLEEAADLETLSAAIRAMTPEKLDSGFVTVTEGVYRGVGSAGKLMRLVADHLCNQTLELEAAQRRAETAALAKDRFFATMTHELRTPLNGIIGFGQLLVSEAHGSLGAEQYKLYAKDIVDSGHHLVSIIGDILDLAKIEAGRVDLHERLIDLRELTGRCLRMVAPMAAKKNITLHSGGHGRNWTVRADERRLQQAIINLLSNAVKFTRPAGDVGVDFGAEGGWAWVEVWDHGCGVAEKDLPRLFKPFEQLDNGMNRQHEGTGLGLTITRALMQAHGGDVAVESELGVGTKVRLQLPKTRLIPEKFAWSVQSPVEFIDPPEGD